MEKSPKEIYQALSKAGLRVFGMSISGSHSEDYVFFIHANKTVQQWRKDVRDYVDQSLFEDKVSEPTRDEEGGFSIVGGDAKDDVLNGIYDHLINLGYVEISDVVADVYEGRVATTEACLVDDPVHVDQNDGFGHFGWESSQIETGEMEIEDEEDDPDGPFLFKDV